MGSERIEIAGVIDERRRPKDEGELDPRDVGLSILVSWIQATKQTTAGRRDMSSCAGLEGSHAGEGNHGDDGVGRGWIWRRALGGGENEEGPDRVRVWRMLLSTGEKDGKVRDGCHSAIGGHGAGGSLPRPPYVNREGR